MIDKIKQLEITNEILAELEKNIKEQKEIKLQLEQELCEEALENGTKTIETGGKKYSFRFKNVYSILGGAKQTPQRARVFDILAETGYAEDIEIIQTIDGRKLQSALSKIPFELKEELIKDKILSVYTKPEVRIK